jgi:hypothetical protein
MDDLARIGLRSGNTLIFQRVGDHNVLSRQLIPDLVARFGAGRQLDGSQILQH